MNVKTESRINSEMLLVCESEFVTIEESVRRVVPALVDAFWGWEEGPRITNTSLDPTCSIPHHMQQTPAETGL